MIIDELRQQFPEIASLDTEEIVDYAHKRVAPDMDYNEFSRKLGYEPSVVKRTLKGVVSGAENMLIKGTVAGLGTYYQAQGEKANEPEKDLSYRVGTKMVDWAKSYKPKFEPSTTEAQTFSSKLGTGAGSLVAFIGAAPAGVMGQFGMIYGSHYLQIDAERPEWTEDKKREYAVIQGAIETALEKAGTSYITDPFTKVGKALTGQVLKKSALWGIAKSSMEGFLSESTQEGTQQIGNNVIDKAYKIDRNLMDGVFESALIGGILGGSVRGFGTSLLSISQKDQLKAVGLDNKDIDALSKDMGEVIDNTIKENPDAVKEASDILKEGISKDSTGQVKQSLIDNGVSEDDANSLVENMIPEDIEELVELETEETLDAYETEKANIIQQLVDEGTPMDVAEQSIEVLDKAMDSFAKLQNKTKVDVLKNIVLQRKVTPQGAEQYMVDAMKNDIDNWISPETIVTETGEGGREAFTRTKRVVADWIEGLNATKKEINNVINKVSEGKKLTETQQIIYDEMVESWGGTERANIELGQPLLQTGTETKGSYQRIDGKDVITLFETADASTLVHEMAHMFLTWSMETGVDLSRVKKFAGVKDITPRNIRNVQEKFARGFEAYLREGKAPDAEMKSVFDNFKEWLGEIYKSIKELNIKLTPEITSFFDDMITGKLVDTTSVKQNIAVDNKAKYENNEKYHKIIPEVKSIDVNKIKPLNGMETQSVSSEVANNMDFSEPINVSVFSDGEIMVTDGHHRLASAKQLGMKEINVVLQAINAKGKTINNLINAQQATEKKLTGIELFQKAIEEIDNKRKELLERLAKGREKAIEARRKKKEYIDDIKEIQKELTDFIQGLDLEAKDKAKFIGRIAKTTTRRTLARQVMEISERATDLKSQELKREYKKQIAKELKATKDVKQGTKTVGKYDYETNKLFTDLRRYNKMSKAQALDAQIDKADPTPYERIAISFLDYKANGVESSVQLMEQVYNDITLAKELGSQAKSEDELENKINRYEKRKEIAESLTANKMTKNAITRAIASGYAKGFGNIQSIIGAIMNKKLADELNMEILESNRDTQFYNTTKTMASLGSEILGVDTKDFVNEMDKMSNKEFSIKDKDGLVKELDVMQLLHIYLGIKNDKVRDAYNFHYAIDEGIAEIQLGENTYTLTTQVAQLLSNLSTEQIEFADMLQSTVQSYYGKVNEVHIRNTGKDLGRVENYFPMKSEFEQDFIDDIKQVGETPSYAKERSAGLALPDPQNAWNMATKHIAQAEHQTTISERYVELKRILNSNQRIELENGDTVTIKKLIQDLYGKDMFTTMNDALDDLSLGAYSKSLDAVSKMFGRALNNWVVAKIALNPSVFVKQLISIGNYQEDMKFTEWNKYFVEGMSDPVKTWKYMMDISPYLRSRLDTGYNEALQRVMDDSQKLSKMKNSWVKALTSMTRYGDITAIIYGGYPLIQKQLAEGKTIEQAEEAFRQATIRSQQSGLSSSRSRFQNQNNPIARMFLAFKNTPTQYLRKLVDAQIQLANNEITKEQYAKTMTIYAVIQPALFAFSGVAMKSLLYGDDFSELFANIMEAIATSPFNAIPVISDIIKYGYRKATGQKVWNVLSTPMLDDIESLVKSMGDSDISISDILSELAYVGEIATGTPFKTGERIIKRNIDRFAN